MSQNIESQVIFRSTKKLWLKFSQFKFDYLFPTYVKEVQYENQNDKNVQPGQKLKIILKDDTQYTLKIKSIKNNSKTITYQVNNNELHTMNLVYITEYNQTALFWQTDFFEEQEQEQITNLSNLKIDYFVDLQKQVLKDKQQELVELRKDFPNEYNQALNILQMLGKKDIISWEKASYVIQQDKKPKHESQSDHFNYDNFLEIAEKIFYTTYYVPNKRFHQRSVDFCQNTEHLNIKLKQLNPFKERNQAKNILCMIGKKDLKTWENTKKVIINDKKPKDHCDNDFNYEKFLQHCEEIYNSSYKELQHQETPKRKVTDSLIKKEDLVGIQGNYNQEKRFAKNMIIMLSNKQLISWEEAKKAITTSKKPKSECEEGFNYEQFLQYVEDEYNHHAKINQIKKHKKSSVGIEEELEIQDLALKKYQSGLQEAPREIHEFAKERDQALNMLAMLSKDVLVSWELTKKDIQLRKPNDQEHCGSEFDYDQFMKHCQNLYQLYYQQPDRKISYQ